MTTRLQSTYLGGSDFELIEALAVHPQSGDIYVTGETFSTDFPGVTNGAQPTPGRMIDGFLARLDEKLSTLRQSTYFGGNADEMLYALAVHPTTGDVYVAGESLSTNLPFTAGGAQPAHAIDGGSLDGFVVSFDATLRAARQATYLGGDSLDRARGIAIHPVSGEVYVTGETISTNFPGTGGGAQSMKAAVYDAFVSRLDAALSNVIQSTYFGGDNSDIAYAMAIHPSTGDIVITGSTTSTSLPGTAGAEQTAKSGTYDGFVSRFSLDLSDADSTPDPFAFAPRFNVPPGSLQTAGPVQITGIAGIVRVTLSGSVLPRYCVSSTASCTACDISGGWVSTPGFASNNLYACIRLSGPITAPAQAKATLVVGGGWANFLVTTGNEVGAPCSLDVDGNQAIDALTDGLLIIRAMFGLTGTAVTSNAVGNGATRATWAQIRPYLNGNCGTSFGP
ncbi:MAG: hypothetical protein ABI831_17015 [Betaproteobacteria bacterium]